MKCYLCNEEITDDTKHYEHIIPNGIAGKLKSDTILHRACGERLGKEIDVYLANKFSILINMFNTKRDRSTNSSVKFPISIGNKKLMCTLSEGKIYFNNFYKDEANKKIYCSKKNVEKLKNNFHDFTYITECDISILEPELKKLIELSTKDKECLTKIAVEFALFYEIPIEHLSSAFDTENKKFKTPGIIPYRAINSFEYVIENLKWYFEKQRIHSEKSTIINSEYPTHALHLFNHKNKLYCFISLFSFFEFYTLLSDNYTYKNISEWHIESVVKTSAYDISYDLKNRDPKNMMICAMHFGEKIENIQKKIDNAKSDPSYNGILTKKIYTEYKKQDCSMYMLHIAKRILSAILLKKIVKNEEILRKYIPEEIKSCIDFDYEYIIEDITFLFYNLEGNDFFDMDRYKTQVFTNHTEVILPEILGTPEEEQLCREYRMRMLYLAIGSSELLYPSKEV